VAAATAVAAARCGAKTLLVAAAGADAAGVLDAAAVLGIDVASTSTETPMEGAEGLDVQRLDAGQHIGHIGPALQERLIGLARTLGVQALAVDQLLDLPGARDVLVLLQLREQVRQGAWDVVVLDGPPIEATLRMVAGPASLAAALAALLPIERRISRLLTRPPGSPVSGDPDTPSDDVLVAAADDLAAELLALDELLRNPATSVRLVIPPEPAGLAAARRAWSELALHGLRVDQVVLNRLFPAGGSSWQAGWAGVQRGVVTAAQAVFAPAPIRQALHAETAPTGVAAITGIGEQLYGTPSLEQVLGPAEPGVVAALQVREAADGYMLEVPLPLAERDNLELGRRGDDLVIGLSGSRRTFPLPSALRRCTVTGATLREGVLRVSFTPDPTQWRPQWRRP
jgi:arsenite/tail-anchored protein-transporting ATPase